MAPSHLGRLMTAALVAAVVLAGCSSGPPTSTTAAQPAPTVEVIDVARLTAGPPARATSISGDVLRWRGRTITTDLPVDAVRPQVLGSVDGRLVVTGYQVDGSSSGDRFWAIDASGHAQRVGGSYQSADYAPRLVASTGHLWVHHADRTTPRTIWELDVRTGREVATYGGGRVPRGLAPADQSLVDAWVARRTAVADADAQTDDGSLRAGLATVTLAAGMFGDSVVVRRIDGRGVVARFTFPDAVGVGVDRVVFEDDTHVLVLTTVSSTRRGGPQQAIVRCSVPDGTCERTTDVGGRMALGVVRPRFVRRGA